MTTHVLVEISGGVLSNIIIDPPGSDFTVWLRDYDDLASEGISDEQAECTEPVLWWGLKDSTAPESFTGKQNDTK